MSESEQTQRPDGGEPRPEPLRFFGTTWLHHDGGYALRRAGVAAGSLIAAAAGALLLRFAYQGFQSAAVGTVVNVLFVVALAVCTLLAFRRTWDGYVRRPEGAPPEGRGLLLIGFVGSLLAYFVRSLIEAPGEKLLRAEYERAREQYERRRAGNPSARKRKRR
ncbi:hypothetical protein SCATT_25860 [Streptantibioticus cattleyicolor NRRL 8057 = DSM 46488]|uniref:EamA/RhaT family transporter n=1 Tax=Streptantibioticus cattleyicolor (strain ATCC 35852 / DSM 46488 / JCM 4925 / NBRC 14057 / NRRL 8057) TaxID=1003195 RepID=G8WWS0_STREN|nr:membrane protein [Streptantibioticus cattleyicolor]AEW94957.1 hypothetical protein SCATT_25860 [Streptantibioticus cattleyicolor NRRL 8057 = DSM 46488]